VTHDHPADWRPGPLPTDHLAAVAEPLLDLLSRTDRALQRYGVPPDHAASAGLREFRLLPGALAASITATDPVPLWQQAVATARRRSAVLAVAEPVRTDDAGLQWSGAGRRAYRAAWAPVATALGTDLPAQLLATADYGDRLARWYAALRSALVRFFLRYGTGPAAVTLRTGPPGDATADELRYATGAATAAADLAAACYDALRPALTAGRRLRPGPAPTLPAARTPDHDTGTDSGAFHAGHD